MAKRINEQVLEHVKNLCYEIALGGAITQDVRDDIVSMTSQYFQENDYRVLNIQCDEANNPSDIVDSNLVIIDIKEESFPGSSTTYLHQIVL